MIQLFLATGRLFSLKYPSDAGGRFTIARVEMMLSSGWNYPQARTQPPINVFFLSSFFCQLNSIFKKNL